MKSREKASGFREGTYTRTGGEQGEGLVSLYIYMLYHHIYVIYTLLYIQGGKHAASACKGGTYPHKEGSTRKRELMIRGDKHKRKNSLVHRGRTRAQGTKMGLGGGTSKGCH